MIHINLPGSETAENGVFGPALGADLEYQIKVAENTVTTDAKGREGGGLMILS